MRGRLSIRFTPLTAVLATLATPPGERWFCSGVPPWPARCLGRTTSWPGVPFPGRLHQSCMKLFRQLSPYLVWRISVSTSLFCPYFALFFTTHLAPFLPCFRGNPLHAPCVEDCPSYWTHRLFVSPAMYGLLSHRYIAGQMAFIYFTHTIDAHLLHPLFRGMLISFVVRSATRLSEGNGPGTPDAG